MRIFTSAAEPTPQDLSRRLRRLRQVFDIDDIRREPLDAPSVVRYYEDCHDAYRKYHSADGAVHMALNDGDRFDADGFFGQLRRMERSWQRPPAAVLELAFGQGFNLAYLAARHPTCELHGIDLTPAHQRIAGERMARAGLANVRLVQGDFHQLPYADASFDEVFCIEAFCYATDVPRALAEAARVLRPGGALTLFDGYLPRPGAQMQPDEALAVELVAKGMAIDGLQVLGELVATGAVIRFPWLGRRALARRSAMRGRNSLAGYLMRSTVALGLIGYRQLVLRKPI